ncbi:hypothetical protein CRI94_15955 [Longibacter salinarum]|uniref:PKD domain-containing protein n=1 Tax=Longibacter salinarum TaxID=1850348 RepID=A0A2A8CU49_9BACT|nr:FG-GAP repeat protein [Longibacter salinarum]PEN11283.1 hypothetical protein CRI94_15955 [Longibacter salinarum]
MSRPIRSHPAIRWATAVVLAITLLGGLSAPTVAQIFELPRPDTSDTRSFGVAVAISGDVAIVGASGENECGTNSGAAYVYERDTTSGAWNRTVRLTPSECREGSFFGETVDADGDRVIVSASSEFFAAPKSNAAYIYERQPDGAWRQTARLTGAVGRDEGAFAADVAIRGDRAVITTSGDVDGKFGGSVYVFDYDAGRDSWRRTTRLRASQGVKHGVLGGSLAMDGSRIAVAASTYFDRKPGSVYIFEQDDAGAWTESEILTGIDDFFISLALHENRLIVGQSRAGNKGSGIATVYQDLGATWTKVVTLRPSTPYESGAFGSTVSIDGEWALVTGYDEQLGQDFNIDRVVYAFRRQQDDGSWPQRRIIDIGRVAFGAAIDQDGSAAIISSVPETEAGSAYIVQLR